MSTPIPMLDLMFFLTESVDNPRHVGSVLIFQPPRGGGAGTAREIVEAYRRAAPQPPFNRIPVFRKTGHAALAGGRARSTRPHHVLHLALPAPGSDQQLHELIADLHAPMLERHRPGWKMYVIEGLAGGRFAIYHKVHHALVDGESGMAILRRSLAESPRDRRIRTTVGLEHPHRPAPGAARAARTRSSARRRSWRAGTLIGRAQLDPRSRKRRSRACSATRREQTRAFTAPQTPMNEPIYNARSIAHTALPLQRMKAVARAADATLNDVALCIVDAGINRYLRGGGPRAGPPAGVASARCRCTTRTRSR